MSARRRELVLTLLALFAFTSVVSGLVLRDRAALRADRAAALGDGPAPPAPDARSGRTRELQETF